MSTQHGRDPYDATFARDLDWAQRLHEQLAELPVTEDEVPSDHS